jgi:hypothetical protein
MDLCNYHFLCFDCINDSAGLNRSGGIIILILLAVGFYFLQLQKIFNHFLAQHLSLN